ncbi:MAG: hypothetical protein [Caudoviricetes sp.]|nr:MAG: hypothetical protein [Caudoviricetes sp.]
MADIKSLMGMDAATLRALGEQSGLTFPAGMKKSSMAMQLSQSAASGWLEVNSELMSESAEGYDDMPGFSGSSQMLSDAAHAAQLIAGAGYSNTFHNVMGGSPTAEVAKVQAYLDQLGASAEDVWMHLPKYNENEQSHPAGFLTAYMRDNLIQHQDIMPEMAGHYSGDIMGEYTTSHGDVGSVYGSLAGMYLDKGRYNSEQDYNRDLSGVSRILANQMGAGFKEVAYSAATGGKASYMSVLPQIGDPSIAGHVQHPRQGLRRDGFPLDANIPTVGSGGNYSLIASLTGRPEVRGPNTEAAYNRISDAVKGLAQTYRGETGMGVYRNSVSERDMIMDSASRYADIEDVRSGYANLDEPAYNSSTIRAILENNYDQMESVKQQSFDPVQRRADTSSASGTTDFILLPGNGFTGDFGAPQDYNSARSRREGKAYADLDAASAQSNPQFNGDVDSSPVKYHRDIKQGTDEWLNMRKNYDITGSTAGTFLGNSPYTTMQKKVAEMEGLYPTSRDAGDNNSFQSQMFARGHASEAKARPRVEKEYGINIEEVGAITNSDYPNMMYSPDGLIGEDALWEHKNPSVTKKFADLKSGEHQDYMDQIQLGMHLSGRSKTLFSQTVGSETRSEWIDADPDWYNRNKEQLDSVAGRRSAVRDYMAGHQKQYEDDLAAAPDQKAADLITRRYRLGAQKAAKGPASDFMDDSPSNEPTFTPNTSPSASTGLSVAGSGGLNPMSEAVKDGILAAQEENKSKAGAGSAGFQPDADFDDLGSPRGWNNASLRRQLGDDEEAGGGGGGGKKPPFNLFSNQSPWGNIAGGIAGGSMASARGGFNKALTNGGPIGQTIALGLGAAGIAGEAISSMADYIGTANDAGEDNAVAFDSMSQGLEVLGLNQQQADRANRTVHSDYNRLQNGDPSGVIRIATGTRGLLSVSDVREAEGDPVRLATIFRDRAKARGWSDARIAGAAEMAGLDGFARVTHATDGPVSTANGLVARRRGEDVSQGQANFREANAYRAVSSPDYFVPRYGLEEGSEAGLAAGQGMGSAFSTIENGRSVIHEAMNHDEALRHLESGNDPHAVSSSGAKGRYQVLDSTARKPGFGIVGIRDNSVEERERVGREYMDAMSKRYGGDMRKADAAYTDGAGTVDDAVKNFGNDWLHHMPAQAQKRVADMEKLGVYSGAGRFAGSPAATGQAGQTNINVTIEAQVNQKTATANVAATGGQTTTQTINMNHGASQRR